MPRSIRPKIKKNNQNHSKNSPLFLYLIFGFLVILSLYLLSPLNRISDITVVGSQSLDSQEVIEQSQMGIGNDFWQTFRKRRMIEKHLKNEFPQIKQVEITIGGVNKFTTTIDEHRTVAFLEKEDETYDRILENGERISGSENISGQVPTIINAKDMDDLKLLIKQLSQLEDSVLGLISEIEPVTNETNPLLIRSYMNDGNQVLASIPTFAKGLKLYPNLVESVDYQKGLFDLEAGTYFIPFATEENQTGKEDLSDKADQPVDGLNNPDDEGNN